MWLNIDFIFLFNIKYKYNMFGWLLFFLFWVTWFAYNSKTTQKGAFRSSLQVWQGYEDPIYADVPNVITTNSYDNLFAYDIIDSSTQSTLVTTFWTIMVFSLLGFVVTAVVYLQYEKFDWKVRAFVLICGLICLGMAIWRVYAIHTGYDISPNIYNNKEFMYDVSTDISTGQSQKSFVFTPDVSIKNFDKARTRALIFGWAIVLISLGACAAMVREWYTEHSQPKLPPTPFQRYRNPYPS